MPLRDNSEIKIDDRGQIVGTYSSDLPPDGYRQPLPAGKSLREAATRSDAYSTEAELAA